MLTIEFRGRLRPELPTARRRHSASGFALLYFLLAPAWGLDCRVVAVSDGDTLKARCPDGIVTVRLAEIDAPEKSQPFGRASRRRLAELCLGQTATLARQATDRYGRAVARVRCQGEDASVAQLRQGMAWVYERYVRDQSLYDIQSAARQQALGLWSVPSPQAPWLWRKLGQSAAQPARSAP